MNKRELALELFRLMAENEGESVVDFDDNTDFDCDCFVEEASKAA